MISEKDQDFIEAFGRNLRKLRKQKKLSQEELSGKMETAPSQIGRIERGEINPRLTTIKSLAEALGIKLDELFHFDYTS